jgi:hypothetical protein
MEPTDQLFGFLEAAADDPKLTPAHISLYAALVYAWRRNGSQNPVSVMRTEVMRRSKIAGRTTYAKCIQELHHYGYIRYIPSFNHFLGSLVYLAGFPECVARIQVERGRM